MLCWEFWGCLDFFGFSEYLGVFEEVFEVRKADFGVRKADFGVWMTHIGILGGIFWGLGVWRCSVVLRWDFWGCLGLFGVLWVL